MLFQKKTERIDFREFLSGSNGSPSPHTSIHNNLYSITAFPLVSGYLLPPMSFSPDLGFTITLTVILAAFGLTLAERLLIKLRFTFGASIINTALKIGLPILGVGWFLYYFIVRNPF